MLNKAVIAILLLSTSASSLPEDGQKPGTAYLGGYWFDGSQFVKRNVFIQNGRIQKGKIPKEVTNIDIRDQYVIPPFCEGHNHDIGSGKQNERNQRYLGAGVFYVNILNNEPKAAQAERSFWNSPNTVDVSFSNGGFTGFGGHPVEVLEAIKKGGGFPPETQLANAAYFEVDTVQDVEKKWPAFLASNPDVVKIYLQFSDEYEQRKVKPDFYGNRGVSPAVTSRIIKLAHAAGKRVFAHTVSANDFGIAVRAGVDVVAHLPGYMSLESIAPADARLAAKRGISVITTASLAASYPVKNVSRDTLKAKQIENLQILKNAGVKLVIGSDIWGDTSHKEVSYLRSLGVFSDVEILKMWTGNCPKMIFPSRKIGTLSPGSEASFLILDGNPLSDFEATKRISAIVKNGQALPKATK